MNPSPFTSPFTYKDFVDKVAIDRNLKAKINPVIEYEYKVRSQIVVSMINPQPKELILDVGCGSGIDLVKMAQKDCRCVGIDLSTTMIKEAQKELQKNHIKGVKLVIGDATNLNFPDETFDKVFSSEVLEHIPNCNRAISEIVRVLKTDGCLVITTPNRHSLYGFDRYLIYEKLLRRKWQVPYDAWKTFDELASALTRNGLKIESVLGVCYIPGFLLSYRLPKAVGKILVFVVNNLESFFSKIFPKHAYLLAIKAIKKN